MTPAEFRDAVLAEWKASTDVSMGPPLDRVLARMMDDARKSVRTAIAAGLRREAECAASFDLRRASALRIAAHDVDAGRI